MYVMKWNTVHDFLYNKTKQMRQFPKFTPAWNSKCFGQFLCPSSVVYLLYTRHWYMSYRFEDSFRAIPSWSCSKAVYKPVWHITLLSVQWINSWWWTDKLSETCRVSWQNKCVKLVHQVAFITKKFITMHGHTNVKFAICTFVTYFSLKICRNVTSNPYHLQCALVRPSFNGS
jgi:hypothetical protein